MLVDGLKNLSLNDSKGELAETSQPNYFTEEKENIPPGPPQKKFKASKSPEKTEVNLN